MTSIKIEWKEKDGGYKTKEFKGRGNDNQRYGNKQITRKNKIPGNNNNLAKENNIRQIPTKEKEEIFIEDDSMIKNIIGAYSSRDQYHKQKQSHRGVL